MAAQFGGLDRDGESQGDLEALGQKLVRASLAARAPYEFRFHLLADPDTVNAFALPGGPIFITRGLLDRLENEAQLAGVLGHEIGHVIGRHAAERIAKGQLAESLVTAVGVAASDEAGRGGQTAAALAGMVAQVATMRFGREDELQSDSLGVEIMAQAGYDPRALLRVMEILAEASGGSGRPEFLSTHPDPGNRRETITARIAELFPAGVDPRLTLGRPIELAP
jgi:predicted Zn-dependent protease